MYRALYRLIFSGSPLFFIFFVFYSCLFVRRIYHPSHSRKGQCCCAAEVRAVSTYLCKKKCLDFIIITSLCFQMPGVVGWSTAAAPVTCWTYPDSWLITFKRAFSTTGRYCAFHQTTIPYHVCDFHLFITSNFFKTSISVFASAGRSIAGSGQTRSGRRGRELSTARFLFRKAVPRKYHLVGYCHSCSLLWNRTPFRRGTFL
ncbi:unnamed protein product [Pylaiella littoralis]